MQEEDREDRDLIPSLPPPDRPTITWDQYCHAPTDQWEDTACMYMYLDSQYMYIDTQYMYE